jgi:hypothetical protein
MKTLAAAVVLVACAGCATVGPASWAGSAEGGTRTTSERGSVSRGIATMTRNDKPYLVFLTAGCEPVNAASGPWAGGTIKALDKRELKWTCDTWDGVTGRVLINGQKFKLDQGGMFFVDMRDGNMIILQAAVDMQQLFGGPIEQRLKELATSDERIARFLAACDLPR